MMGSKILFLVLATNLLANLLRYFFIFFSEISGKCSCNGNKLSLSSGSEHAVTNVRISIENIIINLVMFLI